MHPIFRRFFRVVGLPALSLAVFALHGGHWMVLQGAAWTSMMATYSEASGSFVEAAEKTFSGDFPCAMCKRIDKASAEEKKRAPVLQTVVKLDWLAGAPLPSAPLPPFLKDTVFFELMSGSSIWSDAPPVPIPIAGFITIA